MMIAVSDRYLGRLRMTALAAVLISAAVSLGFTLYAGRHNPSWLLITLMSIWVLSPFVALVWANSISHRWRLPTRATLYIVMLVVALSSLAVYARYTLVPRRSQAAFVFVVVPPASWLLIAVALAGAVFVSSRPSERVKRVQRI